MMIYTKLESLPSFTTGPVLTIGNFDGVHLGHRAVLAVLQQRAAQSNASAVVMTFSNHPAQFLKPDQPHCLITSLDHRITLLEKAGIDHLLLLPFTRQFSEQTPEEFITTLRAYLPFKELVLGHDAVLGKERSGSPATMQPLAQKHHFKLDYIPEVQLANQPISSSTIRKAIHAGDMLTAAELLGRPFSIYANTQAGLGLGKNIGYPTLNIPVQGLCLPPLGVYAVRVQVADQFLPAVANLGYAPTVRKDNIPLLEVFLLEGSPGSPLEVFFHTYLRPEKRFASLEELKTQIGKDVDAAKQLLSVHPHLEFEE